MAFTEYLTDSQVLAKIDEKELAMLAGRRYSETWLKQALDEAKRTAYQVFESYALNKYSIEQLRTDPVPQFAITICLKITLYELYYSFGNRHVIPVAIDEEYKRIMKLLESWGTAQIIGIGIEEDTTASATILHNKSEDDLEFTYEDQEGMW